MSLNSSRRVTKKKYNEGMPYREESSGMFLGIRTINKSEDVVDKEESYAKTPTVIFNTDNSKVIFYYNTRDRDEINEMETFFKRTVTKGDILTLTDASYLNEASGDSTLYDISGTYTFQTFDSNTKTVTAIPVLLNKQSSTYLRYDSKYWLGSLLWSTSSITYNKNISYEIINFVGPDNDNSFSSIFGDIRKNDKIEIKNMGVYTIESFHVEEDEQWEKIKVLENIAKKDLLGEPTFIRILRNNTSSGENMVLARGACCFPNTTTNCSGKPKKTGEQCYNKTETACTNEYGVWHSGKKCKNGCCPKLDPVPTSLIIPPTNLNPLISSDPQPDSTPPSAPSSKSTTREQITAEKTAQKLKERRKEQQNLEQKRNQEKIKWLIGGSKTITVKVVPNKNRSFSFSINGKNPNEPLELIRGITYRFNQTDKSNGLSGISHQEHPIMFSKGKDGKHNNHFSLPVVKSNKLPGNRGSYLYFTAQVTGSLYYYCQNHPNMEGIINVIDDVGEQRSQDIQEEKLKILVAEINTCCDEDCLLCILDSIRIVESGGVDNQCNTPSTDDGDDCGPYQIGQDYWDDALKSCSFPGRSAPLPGGKNCCDLKKYSHSKLCDPCLAGPGYDACCEEKERMSKLAIQCYWRLHTRNCGGSTDEPCCQCGNCGIPDCNINSDCAGNVYIPRSSNPNQDSFLGCFTCEDLARIHNDGPDWCENTSQTNNYIRKIKEALCNSENPHCKACCGSTGKFGCGCSPENDKNRLGNITT